MVVTGKPRGNAPQLAKYLLSQGENERITILDVDGRLNPSESYFKNVLYSMELNSELTRSNKSVYHAMLNPDPNQKEDRVMSAQDWQRSADILAQHLTLEQQRRVIVLHEKKGRIHAHVVFERYDHEKDRMVDYKQNYKAHDNARFEIEKELGHRHTPQKNKDKPQHKKTLTQLWKDSASGEDFINRANAFGYRIAKGTDRPFRVVDQKGVSFDLLRQLDGIKTKEVRERFATVILLNEKEAIEMVNSLPKPTQPTIPQDEVIKPLDKPAKTNFSTAHSAPSKTTNNIEEEKDSIRQPNKEEQKRHFIEELQRAKEDNQRVKGLLRTFCLTAFLMLRTVLDKTPSPVKSLLKLFEQSKVLITQPASITAIKSRKEELYINHKNKKYELG